jgi:phosphohistidine phosphatase
MNLYIMRHGLAVDRATPGYAFDSKRPLTPEGRRKVQQVAKAFARMEIAFDAILASPLVRARQTAELVKEELKHRRKCLLTEHLSPGGSARQLVKLMQNLPEPPQDVLLVGHEPDLGQLAALLLTGGEALDIRFKKGGVARLSLRDLGMAPHLAPIGDDDLTPRTTCRYLSQFRSRVPTRSGSISDPSNISGDQSREVSLAVATWITIGHRLFHSEHRESNRLMKLQEIESGPRQTRRCRPPRVTIDSNRQ